MNAEDPALSVTRLSRLVLPKAEQDWLVEPLWAFQAVGCIGGMPKVGKTWLALELALAVASGRPCLGRFEVKHPGPVLLHCAEDGARAVRDRVAGLARVRGVPFDRLAVGWIETPSLLLDDLRCRRRLARTVAEMKPRMLILDPLVRMHRGDENSATAVAEMLGYLRSLQQEYGVAVVLVHHVRKSGASEPGQALRGSGDLHAWGDSNAYLVRRQGQCQLVVEHRAHRAPPPVRVSLEGDPPRLVVGEDVEEAPADPLEDRVLAALAPGPLTRTALRERLKVRNETLGEVVEKMITAKQIIRVGEGLAVPVPPSGDRRERNGP